MSYTAMRYLPYHATLVRKIYAKARSANINGGRKGAVDAIVVALEKITHV